MLNSITCQALGRASDIGDLYDARREQFCHVNIFKKSPPRTAINITDNKNVYALYSSARKLNDKFNSMDISGQLRASILSNIIQLSGSGKYLSDEKVSERAVRASLIYNVKTVSERLNIYNEDLKPIIDTQAAQYPQATHVVVGVQWGANAFLSIEHSNSSNRSVQDVRAELKATIAILKFEISAGGKGKFNEEQMKESEECNFQIFADLLPVQTELSQTLKGYLNLMNQMPELLKHANDGKGKPLSYAMIPISTVQKHVGLASLTNDLIQDMEQQTIAAIENLFDEISIVKQKVNDLHADIERQLDCCGQAALDRISEIKGKFVTNEGNLRSKLATALVQFRSFQADSSVFQGPISKFHEDDYSIKNVQTMLNEFGPMKAKAQLVDILKTKGVRYVGRNQTLDTLFLQFPKRNIYVLNYSMEARKRDETLWEANRRAFFKLLEEREKENGPVCVFSEYERGDDQTDSTSGTISISHFVDGARVSKDLVADSEKFANLSLARSTKVTPSDSRPNKRTIFETKCPGAYANICKNANYDWQCSKCFQVLEYGFNNNVYCACGEAPIGSFTFKCNDPQHGSTYLQFDDAEILSKTVKELKPLREYKQLNILLLGETGVGKSTWINGIHKYLTYSTLEDAASDEISYLIPTKFTMTDDDYKATVITMGSDKNEDVVDGQSATQRPKSYVFNTKDTCVCLIDTPGIGDTRGAKQDKKNFQNILAQIAQYDEIHGICILLKPNNSRLTIMFQFCIKELLTHLHKDCCKNIVFVFTNARNTFYRPGDTLASLQKLLSQNKDVEIPLAKDTIYCMDNESIRFLAATKQGTIRFDETETENYSQSWKKSVIETTRLIDHIRSLKGHSTQQTLSLNDSRRLILAFTEPLATITKHIDENLILAEDKRKEIKALGRTKSDLTGKLIVPVMDLEPRNLDYPVTVCTSSKCIELMTIGDIKKVNYKQRCHERCYLEGVEINTHPNVALKNCDAMSNNTCRRCNCSWEKHMHINYEYDKVSKNVEDENVKKLLNEKNDSIAASTMFMKQVEDRIKQLTYEQNEIVKTASRFGAFLKENAITPYNDVMDQYLEVCIDQEKDKIAIGGNRDNLIALQKMLTKYREEVTILKDAMATNAEKVKLNPDDISKLMNDLFKLPLNGETLKKLIDYELNATHKKVEHNNVYVPSPYSRNKKTTGKNVKKSGEGFLTRVYKRIF